MNTKFLNIDLHMHSTASDGMLSPTELVELCHKNNVEVMALTDHDTTDGLKEAQVAANEKGVQLLNGVEFSATWEKKVLHIVGLNLDIENETLVTALDNLKQQRLTRAERIAKKLEGAGIPNALEGAKKYANGGLIARPHFAQFLVAEGHVKKIPEAFKKYLAHNKKAYVSTEWPSMEDVLNTIKEAGGVAVIAHPLRYKFTASWMRRLFSSFKEAGGQGMEVVCGYYTPTEIEMSIGYALKYDLMGSVGSDYHGFSKHSSQPGSFPPLSKSIQPIWSLLPV